MNCSLMNRVRRIESDREKGGDWSVASSARHPTGRQFMRVGKVICR
jgi:hypothetical protein